MTCTLSVIGGAVAPNVKDIYGLIGATILIGMGFAAVPLAYCIPSEVGPKHDQVNHSFLIAYLSDSAPEMAS